MVLDHLRDRGVRNQRSTVNAQAVALVWSSLGQLEGGGRFEQSSRRLVTEREAGCELSHRLRALGEAFARWPWQQLTRDTPEVIAVIVASNRDWQNSVGGVL